VLLPKIVQLAFQTLLFALQVIEAHLELRNGGNALLDPRERVSHFSEAFIDVANETFRFFRRLFVGALFQAREARAQFERVAAHAGELVGESFGFRFLTFGENGVGENGGGKRCQPGRGGFILREETVSAWTGRIHIKGTLKQSQEQPAPSSLTPFPFVSLRLFRVIPLTAEPGGHLLEKGVRAIRATGVRKARRAAESGSVCQQGEGKGGSILPNRPLWPIDV